MFIGCFAEVITLTIVVKIVFLYTYSGYLNIGQKLPTCHTLDAIYWKKNICKNLLRTLFGKTNGVKSREDMRAYGIKKHLHLQKNSDGETYFKLDAPYVLTKEHQL